MHDSVWRSEESQLLNSHGSLHDDKVHFLDVYLFWWQCHNWFTMLSTILLCNIIIYCSSNRFLGNCDWFPALWCPLVVSRWNYVRMFFVQLLWMSWTCSSLFGISGLSTRVDHSSANSHHTATVTMVTHRALYKLHAFISVRYRYRLQQLLFDQMQTNQCQRMMTLECQWLPCI